MKINKEEFKRYERVRQEGNFNMFSPNARFCTGLDKEKYLNIMSNYDKLKEKFKE